MFKIKKPLLEGDSIPATLSAVGISMQYRGMMEDIPPSKILAEHNVQLPPNVPDTWESCDFFSIINVTLMKVEDQNNVLTKGECHIVKILEGVKHDS